MPRKKPMEDFEVQLPPAMMAKPQEDKGVVMDMATAEIAAVQNYDPSNRTHSAVLNDGSTAVTLTQTDIETYSVAPQADREKTMSILNLLHVLCNRNDILGAVVETIENNVNTKYRLKWRNVRNKEINQGNNEEIKKAIAEFLEKIDLPILIRKAVTTAYMDGTYIMNLKYEGKPDGENMLPEYTVDVYPIGVAQISEYVSGYNDPYILIDMNELKNKLRKTYTKNRKNKALFYENEEKEIAATFPQEVVKAYRDGERYAKLDIGYTGVIRLNNQDKQYGLSPLFRALESIVMLEALGKADRLTAKARAKKVLVQYMNKEILGAGYDKDPYRQIAWSHENLLSAWSNSVVLMTASPAVREVSYVEPKQELTNVDTINYYRNRVMATLGVSFMNINGTSSMTSSNISVKQLMREINKISQQLESVLYKWFKVVLRDAGLDPMLAPMITIIDSEQMEADLRKEFADFVFNKLNMSYQTTLDILGLNIEDEKELREEENAQGLNEVFYPRQTVFGTNVDTTGGDDKGGRPSDKTPDDPEKQQMDKQNNEIKDK